MIFRFFGDSWAWTWSWAQDLDDFAPMLTSDAVKNALFTNVNEISDVISFLKLYIERMGHQNEDDFCYPGFGFKDTVHQRILKEYPTYSGTVNVVFYSDCLRNTEFDQFLVDNSTLPLAQLEKKLDNITIDLLNYVGRHAEETDQHFLFVGGQGTLYKHVFDQCDHTDRLHLITECAVWSCLSTDPTDTPLRWKLTDLQRHETGPRYELYHPEVIDALYTQQNEWGVRATLATWPDSSHMNPVAVLYLVDKIFKYVENNPHVVFGR